LSDRPSRGPSRWGRLAWPLAILGLGLGLRLAFALAYTEQPIGRMPWGDEGAYWSRAVEILGGRWLPRQPFYQDPLLPYVLAGLMKLVGADVARVRVVLAGLGALTPLAIYWAGLRGLGRAEGIVAGLAAAVYGPLVFTDGSIEKEGPGALVAALGLGLAAELAARGPRPWLAGATGMTWGVLALLRANALAVGPIGAVWAACLGGPGSGWRLRAGRAVGFSAGLGLALAPSAIINAGVGRPPELILTTWQLGANFYVGNGPEATGTYVAPPFVEPNPSREALDFQAEAERRAGRPLTPNQVSRFWLGQGLRRWSEAPAASMALLARKLALVGSDSEIPDNQDLGLLRALIPPLGWAALGFGAVLPWAALGLARSPRSPFWWFAALSTAAGLASTALFFVVGRYRIPWVPGLLLLAASGAVDLARRARRGHWRSVGWRVGLLMAPASALAWWPIADPAPDRWGHGLILLALADLGADRLEPAIDWLDDARALGPGPTDRIRALLAGGPVRDRITVLVRSRVEQAIRAGARPDTHQARWLRQFPEGRAESRRLLDEALRDRPDDPEARRELGAWWLGDPDEPEARRHAAIELTRAARGPAGDPSAAIPLALLLKDPAQLPGPSPGLDASRLRLARAILRSASGPGPRP
jgi:hypothetical protein